jgi:hypothetical protein
MDKISPLNNTGDKVVNFAESSQDHAFRMKSLEHKAQDQIQSSGKRSTAKVKQIAGGDGVSKEIVEDKLDAGKVAANRKFNEIQAANRVRNKEAEKANNIALENAKNKAKAAQPIERAKNAGNYMVNLLKPPKDR